MKQKQNNLRIETVPIAQLIFDPENARIHPQRNIDAIAYSLDRFGQVEPLVVQRGTNRVIGGNARLKVMQDEGVSSVEIVMIDCDDDEARDLAITLNRASELGYWDERKLADQLKEITQLEGMRAGFNNSDIQMLERKLSADIRNAQAALMEYKYSIIVECADEQDQCSKMKQLREMGFECRVSIL